MLQLKKTRYYQEGQCEQNQRSRSEYKVHRVERSGKKEEQEQRKRGEKAGSVNRVKSWGPSLPGRGV